MRFLQHSKLEVKPRAALCFACCQRGKVSVRYGTLYLGGSRGPENRSAANRRCCARKTAKQSTETPQWTQTEGSSSAAAEAAQHLTNVLLPMDATPTLAAHVAPHAAFVSDITERADVVLASALFRELSQAFEKLTPLQRFSLHPRF